MLFATTQNMVSSSGHCEDNTCYLPQNKTVYLLQQAKFQPLCASGNSTWHATLISAGFMRSPGRVPPAGSSCARLVVYFLLGCSCAHLAVYLLLGCSCSHLAVYLRLRVRVKASITPRAPLPGASPACALACRLLLAVPIAGTRWPGAGCRGATAAWLTPCLRLTLSLCLEASAVLLVFTD